MIEQPPRRADDDVDAAAEGMFLRSHADAAEDRRGRERRVHGEGGQVLGNLRRELARRRQHQRARRAARPAHQLVQDRQEKRGGLAAAGHRAGEQIASLERGRNRFGLDRCRTGEAEILESPEEVGMKLEVTKRQKILRTRELIMAHLML